jgi:DNA-binding NarL/FixJ family response regulator
MTALKVLLADDHQVIRAGLRMLLDSHEGFDVVGEADNGRKVIAMLQKTVPDVIVMDVSMPELNGIEATTRIVKAYPTVKILALSMHTDRRFIEGMLKAGASGYLVKDCAATELVSAIEIIASGEIYLSPTIAGKVLKNYLNRSPSRRMPGAYKLTSREREILQLIAEGKDTKQIAFELFLSPKTVETHRRNIMEKLNIHNVAKLTKFALKEGLTSLDI